MVARAEMHLERAEDVTRLLVEDAVGGDCVAVTPQLVLQRLDVRGRLRIAVQGKSGPGSILRCGATSLWPTTRVGGMR
jgi:hypothetical protein